MQISFLSFFLWIILFSWQTHPNVWQSSEINFSTSRFDLQQKFDIIEKVASSLSLLKQTNKSTRITHWLCIHIHIGICCLHRLLYENNVKWKRVGSAIKLRYQLNCVRSWCWQDHVDKGSFEKSLTRAYTLRARLNGTKSYCIHRWLNTWIAHCCCIFFISFLLSNERASEWKKNSLFTLLEHCALDLILQNGRCCSYFFFFCTCRRRQYTSFTNSSDKKKQSNNILDDVDNINTCRACRCIVNSKWCMIMTMIETNDWQRERNRACRTFNT